MTTPTPTPEERAREIAEHVAEAYDKEWASKPITGHPFRPVDKHRDSLERKATARRALSEEG